MSTAAQVAPQSLDAIAGMAAASGAIMMKLLDVGVKFIPFLNSDKKKEKRIVEETKKVIDESIKNHHDACSGRTEERLAAGNYRFAAIEARAKEDREAIERRAEKDREAAQVRHQEVIGYLMELKGDK